MLPLIRLVRISIARLLVVSIVKGYLRLVLLLGTGVVILVLQGDNQHCLRVRRHCQWQCSTVKPAEQHLQSCVDQPVCAAALHMQDLAIPVSAMSNRHQPCFYDDSRSRQDEHSKGDLVRPLQRSAPNVYYLIRHGIIVWVLLEQLTPCFGGSLFRLASPLRLGAVWHLFPSCLVYAPFPLPMWLCMPSLQDSLSI